MNTKQLGVTSIILASVIWAIEPILVKLSYENSDFLHTSAIRAIGATLTAIIYLVFIKKSPLKVTRQQLSPLIYIALVGTLVADFLYFIALSQIPVVNAVIIGHMQPMFIIAFGFFLLKTDKLTRYDYLGISLMILSGMLVTTKTVENLFAFRFGTFGDFIVVIATIFWSTSAIVMRKYLTMMNAGVITFYRFFFPALIFIAYLGIISSLLIANIYQVCIGVIIGIGTILYYEGLKRLKAAQVSGLELTTPFFAAILAFLLLNEVVSIIQIIGIALLFGGVYFISKKEE